MPHPVCVPADDLLHTLTQLLRLDLTIEPPDDVVQGKSFMRTPEEGIHLFGSAYDLLSAVQRHVAKDSLSPDGGITPDTVARLVAQCYRRARDEGVEQAVAWFMTQVHADSATWRMFISAQEVWHQGPPCHLGGAVIHGDE